MILIQPGHTCKPWDWVGAGLMDMSRNDRVRMERAHVAAWPALGSAMVDGWLWRCSGGGSQRANSVSTIDFTGHDLDAAIADIEARYRAHGALPRFQTFDDTSPADLVPALRRRGYSESDPTTTMVKPSTAASVDQQAGEATSDIEITPDATAQWLDVYLGAITESRRRINHQIIAQIPEPHAFFGCRRDGRIIATALCVVSFGCAVIECVATQSDSRRLGAARQILAALEQWAAAHGTAWIGLQVTTGNTPAIRLYEQRGYQSAARNQFWVLPADPAADRTPTRPGS
jgi:GNAT superfamily N-acetyltransferase